MSTESTKGQRETDDSLLIWAVSQTNCEPVEKKGHAQNQMRAGSKYLPRQVGINIKYMSSA